MMIYLGCFYFGACCASFFAVCAWRLPLGQSIVQPRSHCDLCHHPLAWYDLLPIVSYLTLRGQCRYCGYPIYRYFFDCEVVGGTLACLFLWHPFSPIEIYLFIILYCLSLVDIFHLTLYPIPTALAFIPLFIVYWPTNHWLSALLIGGGLAAMGYLTEGLGFGDVEILTVLALWFGFETTLLMLLVGCIVCIVFYSAHKLRHPHPIFRQKIAFVPYISLGVFGVLWLG